MKCIACNNEVFPKYSYYIKGVDSKMYYIDFCTCGLGRTRISLSSDAKKTPTNELSFDSLIDRIKIYYDYLYHHKIIKTNEILRLFKILTKGRKLLDVGASIGFTTYLASQMNFEAYACEINENCAKYIQLVYKLPVFNDLFLIDDKFDIVTFYDVLEHMPDPFLVLEKTHSLLNKGGLCFIQLPNSESKIAKKERENWNFLIPPEHLYHFSLKTLRLLTERIGFEVIWERTVNYVECNALFRLLPLKLRNKIFNIIYRNPFYWPGVYEQKGNKGTSIQMIVKKK